MNREIKFRIWSSIYKRWRGIDRENYNFGLIGIKTNKGIMTLVHSTQKDFTVQLFTGLIDKNGREIYEGDIVKHVNSYAFMFPDAYCVNSVEYKKIKDCNSYCFYVDDEILQEGEPYNVEVIGNIFENPELLKNMSKLIKEKSNLHKPIQYKDSNIDF